MYAFGIGSGRFTRASGKVGVNENDGTRRSRGTDGSNPVPSSGESGANLIFRGESRVARMGGIDTRPHLAKRFPEAEHTVGDRNLRPSRQAGAPHIEQQITPRL